ncbi:MAG TPA: ThiF family adenylyltransferase [Sulfurospirillum arcachonense]|nr:ThiF family adenylyltransferase [Sulfurospirillum arcachonense]
MMEFFHRQVQLWGEDTQKSLQDKTIVIIGCGGLGSSLAIGLGATGIGHIHLVDFDEVSVHNIHRQIAFKVGDEGKFKSEIVGKLVKDRCPFVKTTVHVNSFEEFAKKGIKVDLILDGTDNLPVRAEIDKYAKKVNTPWIYGSVEAFNGQVCFFEKSGFGAFKIKKKTPAGIAAPIVMHIASLQANLALRYLAGLSVKKDFLYYLYINDEGELITQKFGMPKEN